MSDSHDISKHIRSYLGVFIALAAFTVITVAVAYGVHVSKPAHIGIALVIAAFKASLVAAIFMHLKWERSASIWWVLLICAFFFLVLISIPVLSMQDAPPGVQHSTWG
jgi:caa(3)-type oxidase subunit IV